MVNAQPFDVSRTRFDDPDAVHATLARIREVAAARAAAARSALDAFSALSGEATSSRGEVYVRVGATGLIEDVEFAEWAPQESPFALGRALQSAHDEAVRRWYRAFEAAAHEEYADAPSLLHATIERTRAMLPERLLPQEGD